MDQQAALDCMRRDDSLPGRLPDNPGGLQRHEQAFLNTLPRSSVTAIKVGQDHCDPVRILWWACEEVNAQCTAGRGVFRGLLRSLPFCCAGAPPFQNKE
jgi:hypothetical protein